MRNGAGTGIEWVAVIKCVGCGMQHGAGAGIEWVAVIKCVGCGMQHPCTHAPPVGNLYPNSEKQPKRVEIPIAAG